jgi:Protein of unknown function (DUF2568)
MLAQVMTAPLPTAKTQRINVLVTMHAMKSVALGIAFLLEIIAFISFACFGLLLPIAHSFQLLVSALLFLALIMFWSSYMAPRAPKKFKVTAYYLSKLLIYALAAVVLFQTQNLLFFIVFVMAVIIDEITLFEHNIS